MDLMVVPIQQQSERKKTNERETKVFKLKSYNLDKIRKKKLL